VCGVGLYSVSCTVTVFTTIPPDDAGAAEEDDFFAPPPEPPQPPVRAATTTTTAPSRENRCVLMSRTTGSWRLRFSRAGTCSENNILVYLIRRCGTKGGSDEVGCADSLGHHGRRRLRIALDLAFPRRDAAERARWVEDSTAADPEPLPARRDGPDPVDHLPRERHRRDRVDRLRRPARRRAARLHDARDLATPAPGRSRRRRDCSRRTTARAALPRPRRRGAWPACGNDARARPAGGRRSGLIA